MLVEFVFVMIPMLILLLLAIQYLLIWRTDSYLQVAAYSAARKLAVSGVVNDQPPSVDDDAKAAAMLYLHGTVPPDQVTLSVSDTNPNFGDPFTVNLQIEYPLLGVPLIRALFTRNEVITVKGPVRSIIESEPPTPASLGLGPNQELEILSSELIGYSSQEYHWEGEVHVHVDFYGSWDPKNIDDNYQWNEHLGHDSGIHWHFSYDTKTDHPTVSEAAGEYAKPVVMPCYLPFINYGRDWLGQPVLRALNTEASDTYISDINGGPVGPAPTKEYEFKYRILWVERKIQSDPNTITLSAGAVMNRE